MLFLKKSCAANHKHSFFLGDSFSKPTFRESDQKFSPQTSHFQPKTKIKKEKIDYSKEAKYPDDQNRKSKELSSVNRVKFSSKSFKSSNEEKSDKQISSHRHNPVVHSLPRKKTTSKSKHGKGGSNLVHLRVEM